MIGHIRLAAIEDRPAVEAVVASAYSPYVPRIGREPGPMLEDYGALILEGRVHVLQAGGKVRGIIVMIPDGNTMLLDNIAVAPSAQGQGFGRLLLEFAEKTARNAGCDCIRLYTNEAMTENIALYSRIGYVETRRLQEKGFRRVYMAKSL